MRARLGRLLPLAGAIVVLAGAPAEAQNGARRAPHPVRPSADTAAFYEWWAHWASTDVGPGGDTALVALPAGVSATGIVLVGLRPPPPSRTVRPPDLAGDHWTPLALHARGGETLLLWVPTDTTGFLTPAPACAAHEARLGVAPDGAWTPVRLNPFCDETYSATEADVILYWVAGDDWPHVEIVTNGPACVPAELYRYDPRARRYVMVRKACGA